MTTFTCPVCRSPVHDGDSYFLFNDPTNYSRQFRVHNHPSTSSNTTCMARLVEAGIAGTLSIGASATKAAALELSLMIARENPHLAERIVALAEKALS